MDARRALLTGLATFSLAAASCSVEMQVSAPPPPEVSRAAPVPTRPPARASRTALRRFDRCRDFLSHVREEGAERVTAWGLPGASGVFGGVVAVAGGATGGRGSAVEAPASVPAPQAMPDSVAGRDYSGTNVQEVGVDEPDVVKTDGRRILALAGGNLYYVEPGHGGAPAGSLDLGDGSGHQLLLAGERAMVLTTLWSGEPRAEGPKEWGAGPRTLVRVVDVRLPQMRVLSRMVLEGEMVSARLVDGVARVVLRTGPTGIRFVHPERGTRRAQNDALRSNRRAVRRSSLEDWLPEFSLEDPGSGVRARGRLVGCDALYRPARFGGFGTVTVVTVDPARPAPGEAASVLSDAEIVYASTESLYVATNRWEDLHPEAAGARIPSRPPRLTTQLHRFDISDARRVTYEASGEVVGHIMSQWSLSEHRGFLRVAATAERQGKREAESAVHVLRQAGRRLVRVSGVGGLGRGERIYAVRFMGDLGYVVTFRQVDPLYVIDLSNPLRPEVAGELKIPGYSAYLHPVEEGRLLGVGQDVTENGQVRGLQMSLFDVSNPRNPRRIDRATLSGGNSVAEFDHRAFLWWPRTGLAVIPVEVWQDNDVSSGAVGFQVSRIAVHRIGRVEHPSDRGQDEDVRRYRAHIRRSLVVGDLLYTLSGAGLLASDAGNLADRFWVGFPEPDPGERIYVE